MLNINKVSLDVEPCEIVFEQKNFLCYVKYFIIVIYYQSLCVKTFCFALFGLQEFKCNWATEHFLLTQL